MMVFARSTACIMSQITLYWLMGTSLDVKCGIQSSSHSFFTAAISVATSLFARPRSIARPSISSISARSTSLESPIAACFDRRSLLTSAGSLVECSITLPSGI